METRASYTLIGTFVLVLMIGLAGFVVWLAKFSSDVKYDEYQIFFAGSVTGLDVGATVRYRGIPVGTVTLIEIAPDDIDKVRVVIQIEASTPVRTDTTASIEMQGITGIAYIQLIGASESAPPLTAEAGQSMPTITASASALEAVFKSAPEMITSAINLMNRASEVLSEDNRASITDTLKNVSEITGEIAAHKQDIGQLISEARTAIANVESVTASIEDVATKLSGNADELIDQANRTLATVDTTFQTADRTITAAEPDIKATLENLRLAATSIREASDAAKDILVDNREPLDDFAQNGLYEFMALIAESRTLVDSLTEIAIQLERDPASFLLGGAQQGYQAP